MRGAGDAGDYQDAGPLLHSPARSSPETRSVSAPSRGRRRPRTPRAPLHGDEWSILRVARYPVHGPATSTRTGGGRGAAFPPPVAALAPKRAVYGDHRRAAGMDGVDDLGVVDALQIDRGDAEVAVAELALDDDQRHAFAGHLDGMRVPQLVRREAPTHPASRATRRSSERAAPAVHGRP